MQIFGQHVDRFAEGRQQGQHLAGPAHLFRLVLLCGKHREWQDERICPSDDGSVEEARVGQPFAHLSAAIDQGEVRDPGAGAPAETRRVVEAHDRGGGVDGGGGLDPRRVADDGERRIR